MNTDKNTEQYLPFLLKEALTIFREGESKKYFSEKNQDFLTETGLIKKIGVSIYTVEELKKNKDLIEFQIPSSAKVKYQTFCGT